MQDQGPLSGQDYTAFLAEESAWKIWDKLDIEKGASGGKRKPWESKS